MFEVLSDKLESVFRRLWGQGTLTETDIDEALRDVRRALLEADVNFRVVKGFVAKVRERAVGIEVMQSLTPAQQIIKIVHEELITILGDGQSRLTWDSHPPTIIMLVGLQGSGKTTTAAKLALHLRRRGQRPLLVAADPYRPAAVTQLAILAKQLDMPVYSDGTSTIMICMGSLKRAQELAASVVIIDTAGRLHIDEPMMAELEEIKSQLHPSEVMLVADAMTGQEAVRIAGEFHSQIGLTGLILTKMDGDARGGAALSMRSVTGVPIKFIGTGEKLDALEPFYPERLASRILGMGDMLTLIEKAEQVVDEQKAKEVEQKIRHKTYDLADFVTQLQQIKRMGSFQQLVELIPGLSSFMRRLPRFDFLTAVDDRKLKKVEAIILSMTPEERHTPNIIDGSRRRRIAQGSGTTPKDVNQLLNQFREMQKLMKQMTSKRGHSPFLPFR